MRHWLGTSDNDRLARLAGLLYLSTIPTTGAWYGIGGSLLGGDTVTLASPQAGRGLLELAMLGTALWLTVRGAAGLRPGAALAG